MHDVSSSCHGSQYGMTHCSFHHSANYTHPPAALLQPGWVRLRSCPVLYPLASVVFTKIIKSNLGCSSNFFSLAISPLPPHAKLVKSFQHIVQCAVYEQCTCCTVLSTHNSLYWRPHAVQKEIILLHASELKFFYHL